MGMAAFPRPRGGAAMTPRPPDALDVAVLLPCRDEEETIGEVVRAFREALPGARCYVYDNGSADGTAGVAAAAGAEVRSEPLPGKGNVVRRMFMDVEADVYVLADGDGTYEAAAAPRMVERLVAGNLDMVVGARADAEGQRARRRGHGPGNALLGWIIRAQFGGAFTDVSSGYRVLSRRLVKSVPITSRRFEIEPELTAHCAHLRLPCAETPTRYVERPPGSASKLSTMRDGRRALLALALLVRDLHPVRFFSAIGAVFALAALGLGIPLFLTWLESGLVPRFPTAILCVGLGLIACGAFLAGLVLDGVSQSLRQAKLLEYMRYPSVREAMGRRREGD